MANTFAAGLCRPPQPGARDPERGLRRQAALPPTPPSGESGAAGARAGRAAVAGDPRPPPPESASRLGDTRRQGTAGDLLVQSPPNRRLGTGPGAERPEAGTRLEGRRRAIAAGRAGL